MLKKIVLYFCLFFWFLFWAPFLFIGLINVSLERKISVFIAKSTLILIRLVCCIIVVTLYPITINLPLFFNPVAGSSNQKELRFSCIHSHFSILQQGRHDVHHTELVVSILIFQSCSRAICPFHDDRQLYPFSFFNPVAGGERRISGVQSLYPFSFFNPVAGYIL